MIIGYDYWDRGLFKEAFEVLTEEKVGKYVKDRNGYLKILIRTSQILNPKSDQEFKLETSGTESILNKLSPDPFLLAGEFVKTARRRKIQGQYDEAVA